MSGLAETLAAAARIEPRLQLAAAMAADLANLSTSQADRIADLILRAGFGFRVLAAMDSPPASPRKVVS